ncbi:putative tyrosinase [Xylariomycetidae sp. FL2044]|nr:putative tyrosinase [Xylariomycetidae sp. FL2044]
MLSREYEHDGDYTSAEPLLENAQARAPAKSLPRRYMAVILTAIALVSIAISFFFWPPPHGTAFECTDGDGGWRQPDVRREWRELSSVERLEYLRAVKCLSSIPSTVCNGTLHDEFAYIHRKIGDYSHEAAPFLPWHRYFIHIYEQTLRRRCQYGGTLPYWDWTRDWANLTQAPVWDAIEGFGGNGNVNTPITVGDGHCVEEGPFAGLQVQYYNEDWNPHCLSRGFLTPDLQDHFGAQRLNSSAMAAVLDESDYYHFLLSLEDGPHSAIPIIVHGDFSRFTAPNDPIFFLHHAQIDRLWWQWQSRDLEARVTAYDGPSRHDSLVEAQLTDMLEMAGLAPDVAVNSVMSINDGEMLCYRYQE